MELIEFYVLVDCNRIDEFHDLCTKINSGPGLYRFKIVEELNNASTYQTFVLRGNWHAYTNMTAESEKSSLIKLVEQFEDY